jgi:hypothetical protein
MQSSSYSFEILMKPEFSRQIKKNAPIRNLMKIPPVGAELFNAEERTDGRTDRQI